MRRIIPFKKSSSSLCPRPANGTSSCSATSYASLSNEISQSTSDEDISIPINSSSSSTDRSQASAKSLSKQISLIDGHENDGIFEIYGDQDSTSPGKNVRSNNRLRIGMSLLKSYLMSAIPTTSTNNSKARSCRINSTRLSNDESVNSTEVKGCGRLRSNNRVHDSYSRNGYQKRVRRFCCTDGRDRRSLLAYLKTYRISKIWVSVLFAMIFLGNVFIQFLSMQPFLQSDTIFINSMNRVLGNNASLRSRSIFDNQTNQRIEKYGAPKSDQIHKVSVDEYLNLLRKSDQDRRLKRKNRTRPSSWKEEYYEMFQTESTFTSSSKTWKKRSISYVNDKAAQSYTNELEYELNASTGKENDVKDYYKWSSQCSRSKLSHRSRIVITGILSSPAASALALIMYQQCNVTQITGVDPMVPNFLKLRLDSMKIYKQLYRIIPKFNLIVPVEAVGVDTIDSPDWLTEFDPTHIVNFESLSDYSNSSVVGMEPTKERLFRIKQSTLVLEQMLRFCTFKFQRMHRKYYDASIKKKKNFQGKLIRFLHVSNLLAPADTDSITQVTQRINEKIMEMYHVSAYRALAVQNFNESIGIPIQHIMLPNLYGPLIPTRSDNKDEIGIHDSKYNIDMLYIDDAMSVLLQALKYIDGLYQLEVDYNAVHQSLHSNHTPLVKYRLNVDSALNNAIRYPYGLSMTESRNSDWINATELIPSSELFGNTYGIPPSEFPCASSCTSTLSLWQSECKSSAFDDIIQVSTNISKGCTYVIYVVDFSDQRTDLIQPRQLSFTNNANVTLCRIAFVSGKSSLVRDVLSSNLNSSVSNQSEILSHYNGHFQWNGWTLIWLNDRDDTGLTDAEISLLYLDPGNFFADSVAKVMLANDPEFAVQPDIHLLRILIGMNRRALPPYKTKDYRKGSPIYRWKEVNAENSRAVAFFAAESSIRPKSIAEYKYLVLASENATEFPEDFDQRQLFFYDESSLLIEANKHRPEFDIQDNVYELFPFQWLLMSVMIHDLQMEEARLFRCAWYDEHLFWSRSGEKNTRHGTEPLSLAYMIGKLKLEKSIGPAIDLKETWLPFMDSVTEQIAVNQRGSDVFIRILARDAQENND